MPNACSHIGVLRLPLPQNRFHEDAAESKGFGLSFFSSPP
jgi:hypothetical protein